MRVIILGWLLLYPVQEVAAQEEKAEGLNRPVAEVNGAIITARMLNHAFEDRLPMTGHRTLSDRRLGEILGEELDKLIATELLTQEAAKLGISLSPEESDKAFQAVIDRFPTKMEFLTAIERRKMTEDDIRFSSDQYALIEKLLQQRVNSGIAFSEDDLKKYYGENKGKFIMPEAVRIRLILISVDPSGFSSDWEVARQEAERVAEMGRDGEAFEALVAEYSGDAQSKAKGGDLGLRHRGRMPFHELDGVAFEIDVGEISDPVRSLYGYMIFKVEEKKPVQQLEYKKINKALLRKELTRSATQKRFSGLMQDLRAQADIQIY